MTDRELDLGAFDTLSFDCYGTLIDWETGILAALTPWLDRNGRSGEDPEALLAAFARSETDIQTAQPELRYAKVLAAVMRRLGEELGLDVTDAEAAAFGVSVGDWPAFSDTPGALARLAENYRLVILSNVDHASFAQSRERLGVAFDAAHLAEDIGSYKPDARNFKYLLAREADHRLLHVAQSLYHDHVPAQAAGMRTVWVDRRAGRSGGATTPVDDVRYDLRVETLAQLAALVG